MIGEKKSGVLWDLLLREKPAKILICLKQSRESVYATILSRETNCTYSHTIKILDVLKKMAIVEFEKVGRIKKVKLTSEGWDISHNLEALLKKFDQIEEKVGDKAKIVKKEKPKPQPKKQ